MTTRRTFLKGVGAGLILPSTWSFFANHLENFGEPLIRAPKVIDNVLYATCWSDDYQLSLDLPDDEPPPADMTIREFRQSVDSDADHWDTEDYDQPIGESFIWDVWPYHYSASAAAFYFLSSIDLGVMTSSAEVKVGYIDFVEGPSPGNDSRFVCVDELGASLLQDRLIAQGHNVAIELVN